MYINIIAEHELILINICYLFLPNLISKSQRFAS